MFRSRVLFTVAVLATSFVLTSSSACNGPDAGCESDDKCRGDRVCIDAQCTSQSRPDHDTGSDAAPTDTLPDSTVGDTRDGDNDGPTDAKPDRDPLVDSDSQPVDSGDAWRADIPSTDDMMVPDSDAGDVDGGEGRTGDLSCHEFGFCQHIMCDRFDYNCKEKYSSRTPEDQLREMDERQRCARENCAGKQGMDRIECMAANCEQEWNQCAVRPSGGSGLDCSNFHACLHLCNGSDSPQSCRADCQQKATGQAQKRLQNYQECLVDNCQDKEGRQRLKCAREQCSDELSKCWRC